MISHDHQCIFTHVPKTAGKSVRSLFGLPEFERDYKPAGERIEGAFGQGHRALAELADRDYFSKYYKFAFVRNPFDRLVSGFFYLANGGCNESDRGFRDAHLARYEGDFAAFVEDLAGFTEFLHFRSQADLLCDANRTLLPDFVGRYETLERDVAVVVDRLGIEPRHLPALNRSEHEGYQRYYDDATRRRVVEVYRDDFEIFSYPYDMT